MLEHPDMRKQQINLHAAGIDVGSAQNFVCVAAQAVKSGQSNVRSFGAFTKDLDDLVEWLKECRIATAAMEATGIYWMSLYDKLEAAEIEVVLVDPPQSNTCPGAKVTCWIASGCSSCTPMACCAARFGPKLRSGGCAEVGSDRRKVRWYFRSIRYRGGFADCRPGCCS